MSPHSLEIGRRPGQSVTTGIRRDETDLRKEVKKEAATRDTLDKTADKYTKARSNDGNATREEEAGYTLWKVHHVFGGGSTGKLAIKVK